MYSKSNISFFQSKEIKSALKSQDVCYNLGQKIPSSGLLSRIYDSIRTAAIVGLYYIVV